MAIVYYITSHGLGHAVRSLAIVNRIPPDREVVLRTLVPCQFLDQELRRTVRHEPAAFDCGVVQRDALHADIDATLKRAAEIQRDHRSRLHDEAAFLRDINARLVVCDAPSLPLVAADRTGIPSLLVANFTWADIYRPYVETRPDFGWLIDELSREYAHATLCLRLPFSGEMSDPPRQRPTPAVVRPIEPIRDELAREHGLDLSVAWVLIYLGQGDMGFRWDRLARLPGYQFLALGTPGQTNPPAPVVTIDARRFPGQNVVAACDVVLAKPGYGIATDCVAASTPLIYCPRDDFAEYPPMRRELDAWGAGIRLELEQFLRGDLAKPLEKALLIRPALAPPVNGIDTVLAAIDEFGGAN